MPELYDTHCHPYLARDKNSDAILKSFFDSGGTDLNTIAVDIPSSQTCIDLAMRYSWVHATIGIHPTHCLEYKDHIEKTMRTLEELYHDNSDHIVAIWECWLDYHWLKAMSKESWLETKEIQDIQKHVFTQQIHLAKKLALPIVIHNRDSSKDILEILKDENCTNFVFHCFIEDREFAQKLIEFAPECKLWFGGVTTFSNAHKVQEVVSRIPLKHIIIETDSPYLTPTPHRGKQENEPIYVQHVLNKITSLRVEQWEEIEKQILKNSREFFWII